MLKINTVSVIGANGTMGTTVSGLIAAFGDAKVFLICRKMEAARNAVDVAVNSVKADSIRARLIPRTYDDFEDCISQSDWIFESVAEDTSIKKEIYQRLTKCRRENSIISTGTSGFSINKLSDNFDEKAKEYFLGTHFFNPPYNLTLCEVISSKKTNPDLFKEMWNYLKNVLYREVIATTDTPAFLGNRIGFHFLNKALQYAVKYQEKGGIDYIDSILGPFTGRGMTPIATSDFVGLDVHKAIVDNVHQNTNDYDNAVFVLPQFVKNLIDEGKLGVKTENGLFKVIVNEDKTKQLLVYDIRSASLRPLKNYNFPFVKEIIKHLRVSNYDKAMQSLKDDSSEEAMLCKHFLISYITYSIVTAQSVSPQITDADIAMSTGFNWIGPVALMQALGGYKEMFRIAIQVDFDGNLVKQLKGIDNKNKVAIKLPFDYRKYFRAKQ